MIEAPVFGAPRLVVTGVVFVLTFVVAVADVLEGVSGALFRFTVATGAAAVEVGAELARLVDADARGVEPGVELATAPDGVLADELSVEDPAPATCPAAESDDGFAESDEVGDSDDEADAEVDDAGFAATELGPPEFVFEHAAIVRLAVSASAAAVRRRMDMEPPVDEM